MDALKVIDKLAKSQLVQSEISLQMQLGLPYLKIINGELCISFLPHKEDYKAGTIQYYAPQYEIAWVYPFEHLALFKNLKYTNGVHAKTPLCEADAAWVLDIGRHYIQELYSACSEVLSFREECGMINDVVLHKYQTAWENAIQHLGLEKLYGLVK